MLDLTIIIVLEAIVIVVSSALVIYMFKFYYLVKDYREIKGLKNTYEIEALKDTYEMECHILNSKIDLLEMKNRELKATCDLLYKERSNNDNNNM